MANIRKWSSSASGNATISGGVNTINWAEGQTPGSVNNSAREMMAQMRGIYTPSEWGWVEFSATVSVASQTSIKLTGNQTTDYTAGRRWRLKSGSTTRYGSVVSSSFTAETTVTVTVDSGSLSASHSLVALSPIDASSNQLPGVTQSFLRNRIINPLFAIDQRNGAASQTITAAAALAYTVDRWYAYCTGANVTGQLIAGTAPNQYAYRFTGAASNTLIGFAQRIEQLNAYDLASGDVTISVTMTASTSKTVTWVLNGPSATADTFGTIASPTVTQIATGTFSATTTRTKFTATISAASMSGFNKGLELRFTVPGLGAAVTWTIESVQLEAGSAATPFERRQYGHEYLLCQRYYQTGPCTVIGYGGAGASIGAPYSFKVIMRGTPTVSQGTNNYLFASSNITGTTSTYATDLNGVIAYRTVTVLGNCQFSEATIFSAEL